MSGNTLPVRQRPIVFSAQYDIPRFQIEQEETRLTGYSNKFKQLYSPITDLYDRGVEAGDLMFSVKRLSRVNGKRKPRSVINPGQEQQPFVSSSLNNLAIPLSLYNKTLGSDDEEKRMNAVHDEVVVRGVSVKRHQYDGKALDTTDSPTIQTQGVMYVLVNGEDTFAPGDYVYYQAPPKDDSVQCYDLANQGHSKSKKRLWTVKRSPKSGLRMDNIAKYINTVLKPDDEAMFLRDLLTKVPTTVEGKYLKRLRVAYEDGMKETDPDLQDLITQPFLAQLKLFFQFALKVKGGKPMRSVAEKLRTFGDNMLNAQRETDYDENRRLVGKVIRGGAPNEMMDVMCMM